MLTVLAEARRQTSVRLAEIAIRRTHQPVRRAINALPWDPPTGMVKRQCTECHYCFATTVDPAWAGTVGNSGYRAVTRRLASSAVSDPVGLIPMSCWKRRIDVRVSGPKIPSTGP
jgi:hypothetical protein